MTTLAPGAPPPRSFRILHVNSVLTGGAYNGLCTNYQITAETATRAVVRVVGTNSINGALVVTNQVINNNAVIESFNVLPPD